MKLMIKEISWDLFATHFSFLKKEKKKPLILSLGNTMAIFKALVVVQSWTKERNLVFMATCSFSENRWQLCHRRDSGSQHIDMCLLSPLVPDLELVHTQMEAFLESKRNKLLSATTTKNNKENCRTQLHWKQWPRAGMMRQHQITNSEDIGKGKFGLPTFSKYAEGHVMNIACKKCPRKLESWHFLVSLD